MGLDMYLRADYQAPAGSPLHAAVLAALDEQRIASLREHGSTLIAGKYAWEKKEAAQSPAYAVLAEATVTPDPEAPYFDLAREADTDDLTVSPNVMYWRKDNAIHRWFIEQCADGVDDCQEVPVSAEHLADLVERCERVLREHHLAEELLPTRSGFFFGDTSYDEWYFRGLERTVERLREVIPRATGARGLTYTASW